MNSDEANIEAKEESVPSTCTKSETPNWQLNKGLSECLLEMYERQLWTDVTFKFPKQQDSSEQNDTETLHAHKNVLAARSPVFQAMFYGSCADNTSTVELKDTDKNIMDLFLRFLYSETTTVDVQTATEMLIVSHKYQVFSAVEFCSNYIIHNSLTCDNACTFLDIALLYDIPTLRDAACQTIDDNAWRAIASDQFLDVSLPCLTYILKGDTLNTSEKFIFEKAMEWSKAECQRKGIVEPDGKTLRNTLGDAFYYLRVPVFNINEFVSCITRKGYYTFDEYEQIVTAISGIKGKQTLHFEKPRITLMNRVGFDEAAGKKKQKQISGPVLRCRFEIKPIQPFLLNGFSLSPIKLQEKNDPSFVSFSNDFQKHLNCNVTIPSLEYNKSFPIRSGQINFDPPVEVTKQLTITATINVLWSSDVGIFDPFYRCSYFYADIIEYDGDLRCGYFSVRFLRGAGFIDRFFTKRFSYREPVPQLIKDDSHISSLRSTKTTYH